MDPFTLALIASIVLVGYGTAAPDKRTLRATRGAGGVAKAAYRGGSGHIRSERAKTAPQRAKSRANRHEAMRAKGWHGRAAVAAEKTTVKVGRSAAVKTGRAIATTVGAGAAGVKAAPSGYAPAAQAAVDKRNAKKTAKKATPDPQVDAGTTSDKPDASDARCRGCGKAAEVARYVGGVQQGTWCHLCLPPPPSDDWTDPFGVPTSADENLTPTPKENPVTVPSYAIRTSELDNVETFRAEAEKVLDHIRELLDALYELREYASGLGERYASAPFATRPISASVSEVGERSPDSRDLLAFEESMAGLVSSIAAASTVTEAVVEAGASGRTEAFAGN